MTTALVPKEDAAPQVTSDQLDLIKRPVAKDAPPDELKLYLYDCARQGVHPLDKLIFFTKRSGKYTPITSIDFMRTRAADTGEYAGSDDAVHSDHDDSADNWTASVTVYRLVQGQRCAFTATARWSEYKPEQNDFMWKRMPYTMLAKCAEALALRKGFPRQLAGLYAREEMDQAGPSSGGFVVEAPAAQAAALPPTASRENVAGPTTGEHSGASLPDGAVLITRVDGANGRAKGFLFTSAHPFHGKSNGLAMYDDRLADLARECCQAQTPVRVTVKESKTSGKPYVTAITRIERTPIDDWPPMLTDEDVSF